MSRLRSSAGIVAVAGLAVGLLVATVPLSGAGWDPTLFVGFGEDEPAITIYGIERLGDAQVRPKAGHDGKFFFVQAHDPFVLDPDANVALFDRPLYRTQRMLYPAIAGGFGLFDSRVIVWSLLVVNLLALAGGSWATAKIARHMGGSPWWGLAFALNLGLVSELRIAGAGILAAAFAFGAVAALLHGRTGLAIAGLVLSALSREVMLVTAAGCAYWLWARGEKRTATRVGLIPAVAVGIWAVYARIRLVSLEAAGAGADLAFGFPFEGLWLSTQEWLSPFYGEALDPLVAGSILLMFILYVRRSLRSGALVSWAFIGFIPLSVFFSWRVWLKYFDVTRAVAPVLTAFVLLVMLADRPENGFGESIEEPRRAKVDK